jgi:hypothetical protein
VLAVYASCIRCQSCLPGFKALGRGSLLASNRSYCDSSFATWFLYLACNATHSRHHPAHQHACITGVTRLTQSRSDCNNTTVAGFLTSPATEHMTSDHRRVFTCTTGSAASSLLCCNSSCAAWSFTLGLQHNILHSLCQNGLIGMHMQTLDAHWCTSGTAWDSASGTPMRIKFCMYTRAATSAQAVWCAVASGFRRDSRVAMPRVMHAPQAAHTSGCWPLLTIQALFCQLHTQTKQCMCTDMLQ